MRQSILNRHILKPFFQVRRLFSRVEKLFSLLLASAAVTAALMSFDLHFLESRLYDLRMTFGPQPKASGEIVLVSVDEWTLRELEDHSPLALSYHTRLLEKLSQSKPKAIGYLIDFNAVNQIDPDQFEGDWGKRFVQAAHSLMDQGTPVIIGTHIDVNGELLPPYPLASLDHSIAIIHQDGNVFSEDKVTRRAMLELFNKPSFHLQLAQRVQNWPESYMPKGNFQVPVVEGRYFFFKYRGDPGLPSNYERVSFSDIINGRTKPDSLNGKIILIGSQTRQNLDDFTRTPFSKSSFGASKIAIHANILDSIMNNDGIVLLPNAVKGFLTFCFVAMTFWFVLNSTPMVGVFFTIILALLCLLVGQICFMGLFAGWGLSWSIWIPLSHPLVGILFAYYLAVPYRLIREYKKRWEYQRRNQMLVQVEQLKTNFLSLVTHDLKTPVARIQGLTEMVLNRAGHQLDIKERQNLQTVIDSTDELNRFITSILELAKIESDHVQLNLESKDINDIISRSTREFETVLIKAALKHTHGRKNDAAIRLGIGRNTISRKIQELGIEGVKDE